MVDQVTARRWRYHVLFVAVSLAFVLVTLLPLGDGSGGIPGPALPAVIALVWVLRRPDYVPVGLVAGLMLLADLVQMRPPGLWAGIVVLGVEVLRAREAKVRDLPFPGEWALAAAVLAAMTLAYWAMLTLFLVPHPGLGMLLLQLLATVAAYPVVVLVTRGVFGLRRAAPGEVDTLGHRV